MIICCLKTSWGKKKTPADLLILIPVTTTLKNAAFWKIGNIVMKKKGISIVNTFFSLLYDSKVLSQLYKETQIWEKRPLDMYTYIISVYIFYMSNKILWLFVTIHLGRWDEIDWFQLSSKTIIWIVLSWE